MKSSENMNAPRKSVLVTSIGSFAADIVIKNIKKMDMQVVGCDIYPKEWIAASNETNLFYQVPYVYDTEAYLNSIWEICVENKISYIIPLTDVDVDFFCEFENQFTNLGVKICISPKETLYYCRNKQRLTEFVMDRDMGIPIIPTLSVDRVMKEQLEFPVICKVINGRSSQGIQFINNNEEWQCFVKNVPNKEEYIVQPVIKGDVITVDVVREKTGLHTVAVARRELLRTANGAGTSVHVFRDEKLESDAIALANELGIVGCVNFEFIDTGKEYYLLECNPRFSGGAAFSCMAGVDIVRAHIRCFEGLEIETNNKLQEMYIARKYEEYIMRIDS